MPIRLSRGCEPQLDKVEGARLFLQAAQDVRVGGRPSRTQFQYTLQGADIEQLNEWAPKMLVKLKSLPELRDVATDQQTEGTTLTLTINRDQASRYGLTPQLIDDTLYDAFGQRQIAQYFTQLCSYYVIMEILLQLGSRHRARSGYGCNRAGQGPIEPACHHQHEFPGQRSGVPGLALDGPMLILAALVVVYLILGILYESYAMVGGLLVSQALILFTTPVVYIYLDRLSEWLSRGSHSAKSHP